jgi:hypothetical protein
MVSHSLRPMACAGAFALVAMLTTSAHALDRPHRHLHARGGVHARGGDVVVHTGRSYLDSGTSAAIGSENHYFSDSTHYGQDGPDFTQNAAGFELLPGRFGPN